LHLAVAKEIGATSLATLDNRMAENARCFMLSVESI
jgi:predicted nucleic acid-binding protein